RARLAKLDLRSAMVGEFPELQGVMGRYYALEAGEKPVVADAARDHWRPKGESDGVPTEPVSVAVALADRIDTLTGFWAIDEKPTGSKDPFALRRAALGVIRLVLGNGVRMGCVQAFKTAYARRVAIESLQLWADEVKRFDEGRKLRLYEAYQRDGLSDAEWELRIEDQELFDLSSGGDAEPLNSFVIAHYRGLGIDLLSFFHDRLKVYLKDQGIRHDVIDACLAMPGNDDLTLLVKRATALSATLKTEDGANLLQGFKRANNILSQAEAKDGVEYSYGAEVKFAETDEERALFVALDAAEAKIGPAMKKEDFAAAMSAMAALRGPVDVFFTAVQVNSDNPVIRRNRLNLLSRIRTICSGVADLSRIEG
ncbi:MAG: glycine--tRNA ligase subunit beta, partial [Tabrizicola sp.]|nr:glycine--tRNA ligase subunit beta [Tabrizicola sp.]